MPRRTAVTTALRRRPGPPGGFVPIPYPNAVKLASRRLGQIQARHGAGAVAVLSGGGARQTAELIRRIQAGEVRGLVTILFQVRAGNRRLARALDRLDFYLAIDAAIGPASRRADLLLPATGPLAPARELPRNGR